MFLYSLSFASFGSGDYLKIGPLLADEAYLQNGQGKPTNSPEAACSFHESHFLDPASMHLIVVPYFHPSLGPAASQGHNSRSLQP